MQEQAPKSVVLTDPVSGLSKRVFKGQRFLLVQQEDEADKPLVTAWPTQEEANRQLERGRRFMANRGGFAVEYVVEGAF